MVMGMEGDVIIMAMAMIIHVSRACRYFEHGLALYMIASGAYVALVLVGKSDKTVPYIVNAHQLVILVVILFL